jgi:hypothetical protein
LKTLEDLRNGRLRINNAHDDGAKIASPEQMQEWMKQTMEWIGSIAAQNKFASGTGLGSTINYC